MNFCDGPAMHFTEEDHSKYFARKQIQTISLSFTIQNKPLKDFSMFTISSLSSAKVKKLVQLQISLNVIVIAFRNMILFCWMQIFMKSEINRSRSVRQHKLLLSDRTTFDKVPPNKSSTSKWKKFLSITNYSGSRFHDITMLKSAILCCDIYCIQLQEED